MAEGPTYSTECMDALGHPSEQLLLMLLPSLQGDIYLLSSYFVTIRFVAMLIDQALLLTSSLGFGNDPRCPCSETWQRQWQRLATRPLLGIYLKERWT